MSFALTQKEGGDYIVYFRFNLESNHDAYRQNWRFQKRWKFKW